jgi:isocitrate lyase
MLRLNTAQLRISSLARRARAMSALPALPLHPPSVDEEVAEFEHRTDEMARFFAHSRFKGIKRPYSPASVASKQGSLPVTPLPSSLLADKLFNLFTQRASEGKPVHTMGAIDPVQMTQMARNQEVVYVSGWAASSVLTTGNNEVGPDLGLVSTKYSNLYGPYHLCSDYPYTTVPNQVHRIFRAQQLHDKKHYDERMTATVEERAKMTYTDYLRPIIADADTGYVNVAQEDFLRIHFSFSHGGLSTVMKLVKLFAESVNTIIFFPFKGFKHIYVHREHLPST